MKEKIKQILKSNYQQLIFVFLAFFTMVLVSYYYVSGIVNQQMAYIGEEILNTTQTAVSSTLTESKLIFNNSKQTVERMLASDKTNEEILDYLRFTHDYLSSPDSLLPDYMKIYGEIRGEFLDGSETKYPKDFIIANRPWHIGAVNNHGEIFLSEPYKDAVTGEIVISFSQVIFDNSGELKGILAIDMNLTRIIDYIHGQKIVNDGYGILINDSMNFIAHKDETLIGKNMSSAGGDYQKLKAQLKKDKNISATRFQAPDKTDCVIFLHTIFEDWYIGIITPRASYYKQVHMLAAVLSILGLTLMSVLSYILIKTRTEKMRSEEESRSKSSFLARMSHEIRTPMNAIIGMTDIAKKSDDLSKVNYCIDSIHDASNHLLGVINDILDMSKIEAGKLELSESDFIFEKMLKQTYNVIKFKIFEKNQHFNIILDPKIPESIVSDSQRLSQVITNLISNANKFTPDNGTITLNIFKKNVDEQFYIQFEVIDNGIGISPKEQARLFSPFEQADVSITRRFGGTGLGLSISKKIVEALGGNIHVESEPGCGSKFIFTIQTNVGNLSYSEEFQYDVKCKDLRLLVIDKDQKTRDFFKHLATKTDFICETAKNSIDAKKLILTTEPFQIIFMNYLNYCHDLECKNLLGQMKDFNPNIHVIFIAESENAQDFSKLFTEFSAISITKPLFNSSILESMKKSLNQTKLDEREHMSLKSLSQIDFTGKHVLLAEDVEINQIVLTSQLEGTGITFDWADNGRIALEKFRENSDAYDLIFMDIHMPELDGYDTAKAIRNLDIPKAKSIPIIAISADVFLEDIEKSLSAGMNAHIGKPFKLEEVIEKLIEFLKM